MQKTILKKIPFRMYTIKILTTMTKKSIHKNELQKRLTLSVMKNYRQKAPYSN